MGETSEQVAVPGAAAEWPIAAPYLRALKDMGLTDVQIARYFHVEAESVAELRDTHHVDGLSDDGKWRQA
ncbi:hypothetical protein [Amorphus orientalis]|uniref:Uncharacterized protein n=1 Tax=Amorphus orientalis TaxID=649198 RepID=A0AAE3VKR2_9HYPH|nr:hypothetical protein [Amorphus orientalis]MDQ0314259.1 hypothetical protein [Amorphus orientalis]